MTAGAVAGPQTNTRGRNAPSVQTSATSDSIAQGEELSANIWTPPPTPIPEMLRQLDQWVVWRPGKTNLETHKFPKIPYDIVTDTANNDKDPATWLAYQTACRHTQRIGFALSHDDAITMIDCDHCVANRVIDPHVLAFIQRIGGYWEFSPSGTGIKGWVIGKLSENVTGTLDGFAIEVYGFNRFGAVTGDVVPGFGGELVIAQHLLEEIAPRIVRPSKSAPTIDDTPRAIGPARPIISGTADELDAHAQQILCRLRAGKLAPLAYQSLSNELRTTNRAFVEAVAISYVTANPTVSELERRGCNVTGDSNGKTYLSGLPGDKHSHTNSLKVEHDRVWSLSPNSRIPNHGPGLTAFDIVALLDHNGDKVAAARAIFGPSATPTASQAPAPSTPSNQVITRAADAERKRETRKAETEATIADVRARFAADTTISTKAGMVLMALLDIATASEKIHASCRPSNAQLMERTGYKSERTIRDALRELEQLGYLAETTRYANAAGEVWQGGKGTVWRTFLRGQSPDVKNGGIAPESSNLDSCTEESLVINEARASLTPAAAQTSAEPTAPEATPNDETQPLDERTMLAYWERRADEVEARASEPKLRSLPTEEARRRFCEDLQREADRAEAQRLAAVWEEAKALQDAAEQFTLLDSVEDVPVERQQFAPPNDPAARREYHKLLGRARKERRKGHIRAANTLERKANALCELVPVVQQARVVVAEPQAEELDARASQITFVDEQQPVENTSAAKPPCLLQEQPLDSYAISHVRKLLLAMPQRCAIWQRNAQNVQWWEGSHDEDLPFSADAFRVAALAEIALLSEGVSVSA